MSDQRYGNFGPLLRETSCFSNVLLLLGLISRKAGALNASSVFVSLVGIARGQEGSCDERALLSSALPAALIPLHLCRMKKLLPVTRISHSMRFPRWPGHCGPLVDCVNGPWLWKTERPVSSPAWTLSSDLPDVSLMLLRYKIMCVSFFFFCFRFDLSDSCQVHHASQARPVGD